MSSDLFLDLTAPNGLKYKQPIGLFINNEFVKSTSTEKIASINPTDEKEIASVYSASAQDVDTAVAAARKALKAPSWRDLPSTERGDLMLILASLVDKHAETIATIETWDNGKPYSVALSEDMAELSGTLRYYGGYADKIHGQVINTSPDKLAYTLREPVGVCGQVIPFNFPLAMAAWKLGLGLACGNTVVIKAAEQTPLSILYFAQLIKEAGFPPGVVNILNGPRQIMKMASVNLKNITLETGGKSPLIVFADADLNQAVKWSHAGIMSNIGQICTATSRILVEESIYDKVVGLFKDQVKEVSKIGDPFKYNTFQGPQVTKAQYGKVLAYIESGKSEGATLATGSEAYKDVGGKGFFIAPTVFTNVKDNMKIYREEIFGPFVVIASFKTEEEAIDRANDTIYGLGSAVFTENLTKAHRVARRIEAGMVWINSS